MRWFWVDRFTEFHSGKMAKSIKNVSLAEEHLHDHFPGFPVMPPSLMLEGMAQTGGTLLGETHQFEKLVFLAKVPKVTFHHHVRPGDQIVYTATLEDVREEGGMTRVEAHVGDTLVAEGEIFFAQLEADAAGVPAGARQKEFVQSILGAAIAQSRQENSA